MTYLSAVGLERADGFELELEVEAGLAARPAVRP
jgi:hypothetical protein